MKENDGVRGVDLLALLDYAATSGRTGSREDTEARAWTAARFAGHALAWVPWALLAVVLLHGRRPLGPVVRGLLIAHGALVLAGGALIALGASQRAVEAFQADPTLVGPGPWALLGGGLLGLLAGLFGGRRGGFLGAVGLAVLLGAAAVGALVVHLRS